MVDPNLIREHAKVAAQYFQALLIEGVGTDAASAMTQQYVTFYIIRQQQAAAEQAAAEAKP